MKNFFKKITGIDKLEATIADAQSKMLQAVDDTAAHQREAERARQEVELAKEAEELAKLTPKDRATKRKEPWVNVLDIKVNAENVRNGFFELDWNEYFIEQLIQAGYGVKNDPEEEIVDRWFRDIVFNMLQAEGQDTSRGAGYINVVPISKGKAEVS
jgi:uncharacterized protein YmfQ (DUF2313 family)